MFRHSGISAATVILALATGQQSAAADSLPASTQEARERVLSLAERTVGPLDDRFLRDHPPRSTNTDALKIESLASGLGLHLVPRSEASYGRGEGRRYVIPKDARAGAVEGFRSFVHGATRDASGSVPPVPLSVAEYCRWHAGRLDELARVLESSAPQWRQDARLFPEEPAENVRGIESTHDVLLGCAVFREAEGDVEGARRLLDASWALNERRPARAELQDAVLRIRTGQYQMALARRLRAAEQAWVTRKNATDPVNALVEGFRGSAYRELLAVKDVCRAYGSEQGLLGLAARDPEPGHALDKGKLSELYAACMEDRPAPSWVRETLYGGMEAVLRYHEAARASDACDFLLVEPNAILEEAGSGPLELTAALSLSRLRSSWVLARRAAFDAEATTRILAFRRALRAAVERPRSPEQFREFLDAARLPTQSICKQGAWVYEMDIEQRHYLVRWEGPEVRGYFSGLVLPLEQRIPMDEAGRGGHR